MVHGFRLHVQLLLMAVIGGFAVVALASPTLFAGPGPRIVTVRDPPRVVAPIVAPAMLVAPPPKPARHRRARPVVDEVAVETAFLGSGLAFKIATPRFAQAVVNHADVAGTGLAGHVITQLSAMLKRETRFGLRTIRMPAGTVVVTLFDDRASAVAYARLASGSTSGLRGSTGSTIVRGALVVRRTSYGGGSGAADAAIAKAMRRLGLRR